MTTAIRQIKCDLESSSDHAENKRNEYNTWNSIKDELDRVRFFNFPLYIIGDHCSPNTLAKSSGGIKARLMRRRIQQGC